MIPKGILISDLELCNKLIREHGLEDIVIIKAGWFDETLPTLSPNQQFALLHIDCDLYHSTMICMRELYERIVDAAPIIFDDYHYYSPGERLAAKEYLTSTGETFELGPASQAYCRKGKQDLDPKVAVKDPEGDLISCRELQQNRPYQHFLAQVQSHVREQADNLKALLSKLNEG